MAFNTQEQEIIKFGAENGKSQSEIETALAKYRTSQSVAQDTGSTGLKGVGAGFLKSTAETLQNIGNVIAKPVGKLMGVPEEKIGIPQDKLERTGGAEKLGGFISELAQFALPATKVSKLAKGASTATQVVGQVLSDMGVATAQTGSVKEGLKTGVLSTAISSIPIIGKLIPDKYINKVSNISKNIEEINLRLTPTQKLQLEKTAPDITGFLAKQKVTGTPQQRYAKVSTMVDSFEDKIQGVLNAGGKSYTKEEIISAVKGIPDTYLDDVANPEVHKEMIRRTEDFVEFINKQKGDTIPASRVNEFKRSYAKNARNKAGDQVVNDAREAISDGIYNLLQKDIPELKPINQDYRKVLLSQKLLGKALGRNELGLIGNLVGGGVGASIGGSLGGGVGAALGIAAAPKIGKVVAGTRTRSQLGAGIQKLAEYLQNPQIDNLGNIILPKAVVDSIVTD